jgi:hypothetical protein
MKRALVITTVLAAFVLASSPHALLADQRPRNPGGGDGGSSGGGSSGGGDTGRVAVPRDGGASPWGGGGGTVATRPSEPQTPSSGGRRPARVSGGNGGAGMTVPPYSRARGGAPVTGYAVPRGSIATLPPIISGPIYWGPNNWYFYPWGFGGLGLGYFWDPWMWSGYLGGFGGYPWMDPYYGGWGGAGWGGMGGGGWSSGGTVSSGQTSRAATAQHPLDPDAPHGGLRLQVSPRDAQVFVDGYYAGTVDDFDGARQRLKVTIGPHRIELRAPGHETVTFDVTIIEGQTTTYKTSLTRLR